MHERCVVLLERVHDHTESLLLQVRLLGHVPYVCFTPDECVEVTERLRPAAIMFNAGLPMDRVYELGRRLRELEIVTPVMPRVSQPGDQIDCQRSLESGSGITWRSPFMPLF
jgi:DNA-binding response OmpR family regulator